MNSFPRQTPDSLSHTSNFTMLRVLIMCRVCLGGIIGTGLVGPNRSSIEAEFSLSHAQFGTGLAVAQIAIAIAVLIIADSNLGYALMFGPAILWLFGLIYYLTPLSQKAQDEKKT